MTGQLSGKIVLITGAGGTLGNSHACLMAGRGARVIVQDIRADAAKATVDAISQSGGEATALVCDVADIPTLTELIQAEEARLGRIDVLVNNAGISGMTAAFEDIDEANFDRMFDIHFKGSFYAARAVIPGMKARQSGKIINISSSRAGYGAIGGSHYDGAKAALIGLTRAWANEFGGFGITVNAVAPGLVPSDATRRRLGEAVLAKRAAATIAGRLIQPVDVSALVAFLASNDADIINGQVYSMKQHDKPHAG
jgi:3-oxoacyl-[acyl-carrier protein] reductase